MEACKYDASISPKIHTIDTCTICGAEYSLYQREGMAASRSYHERDSEEFGHWCPKDQWCPICLKFQTLNTVRFHEA